MSESIDFENSPYSEFLEGLAESVFDFKPDSIAVGMIRDEDGYVMTAYYNANAQDKSVIIENIRADWLMDIITNNADAIREIILGEGKLLT